MGQEHYRVKPDNYKYDNVDDKKELFNLLANYMDARDREDFLKWCCATVNTDLKKVLRPGRRSSWDEREVYWQVMSLAFMHGLSMEKATQEAVRRAKKV
jgi:hypothetical protein